MITFRGLTPPAKCLRPSGARTTHRTNNRLGLTPKGCPHFAGGDRREPPESLHCKMSPEGATETKPEPLNAKRPLPAQDKRTDT